VIPVEKEIPVLNIGNLELDSMYIQDINSARQERNKALGVAQIYRDLADRNTAKRQKGNSSIIFIMFSIVA